MILNDIVSRTRVRVAALKAESFEADKRAAEELVKQELSAGPFTFPFERALGAAQMNFICEVKKASPSKGVIAEDFPYLEIGQTYEKAGAAAISVLTEPEFFQGDEAYLQQIAEAVDIPVLQKDFIVDECQIYRSKLLGASAILLLCNVLTDEELKHFYELARSLGLSCLVETHNEEEIERALKLNPAIIGINNRDLRDFSVDINNSIRLRKLIPGHIICVSESGINTRDDVKALEENGIYAALIGERFMRAKDKVEALAELYGPMRGVQAKICGLFRNEDIATVNNPTARPAYAGFVFAESPRQVTPQDARNLVSRLAPQIQSVGVFVNESIERMAHLAETIPLKIIQLSGDETEEDIKALRKLTTARIWKAVRVRDVNDVVAWNHSVADLILFDSYVAGQHGGTGQHFDWSLLQECTKPFILAGGLTVKNLARAIRTVRPYAVDVSSGVETDGKKDRHKINEYLRVLRKVRGA